MTVECERILAQNKWERWKLYDFAGVFAGREVGKVGIVEFPTSPDRLKAGQRARLGRRTRIKRCWDAMAWLRLVGTLALPFFTTTHLRPVMPWSSFNISKSSDVDVNGHVHTSSRPCGTICCGEVGIPFQGRRLSRSFHECRKFDGRCQFFFAVFWK